MSVKPADWQINNIYKCCECGKECEMPSDFSEPTCDCGGQMFKSGESYPANQEEWQS